MLSVFGSGCGGWTDQFLCILICCFLACAGIKEQAFECGELDKLENFSNYIVSSYRNLSFFFASPPFSKAPNNIFKRWSLYGAKVIDEQGSA